MSSNSISKKSVRLPSLGSVKILVWQHNISRLVLMLKRSDRTYADNPANAQFLETIDVGSVRKFMRKKTMPATMPSQESNFLILQLPDNITIRRNSKWSFEFNFPS